MVAVLALIKESAGFAGAIALAMPWIRDFVGRLKARQIDEATFAGSLKALANDIIQAQETWLAKPKSFDLVATVTGLVLLAVAFAIGIGEALTRN